MATKSSKDKRQAWEVDFLAVELDKAQKELVKKYDPKGELAWDVLSRCVLDGCKLSLVYDNRNDTCIASLTTPKVEGGPRQCCLSARGPDLLCAMRVLTYKFVVILAEDMSTAKEQAEARGQWG